jgi:hypothetical protein
MEKEQEKRTAPKFDAKKSSKTGDVLATLITGTIAKTKPQSIAEGLLMMTLAIGRTLQVLGTVMGCDPKVMCKDFCDSLTKYFEMGGDGRIDDIAAAMKQKGN